MNVVVVGNSVVWGQGLRPEQKLHRLAVNEITASRGSPASDVVLVAHSGAAIDGYGGAGFQGSGVAHWQEVPHRAPTISVQLDGAVPDAQGPTVDLVILDGGMNDINFRTIMDPLASDEDLERRIEESCYDAMRPLLRKARHKFPNAVVVVVGYYPILSEASRLDILRLTLSVLLFTGGVVGGLMSAAAGKRSTRRLRYFHRRQLSWLRRAVTEIHADAATRGPGVVFAHPAFGPHNSVGAPEALLFGPKRPQDLEDAWDRFRRDPVASLLAIEPDDPMSRERRRACQDLVHDLVDRLQCSVAAIGHPNPRGARRYAEAVASVVIANGRISLREPLTRMLGNDVNQSLREASRRYGLATRPISLRGFIQHATVDCIDVTLETADISFAGTDHDVYLRVSPGRAWRLTESIFDGDLFDDLERGVTSTYTIDPAEGSPERRLRLWEIREITLELRSSGDLLGSLGGAWRPASIAVDLNGQRVLALPIDRALTLDDPTWTAPNFPRAG